jgi:2-polyprenyl-3-methyl-5-hydroxy-6-metoxy-1,4-benzoquinol methylase
MFDPEKNIAQPTPEKNSSEVKIESTRAYESSPAIIELSETKVLFENKITPETRVCLIGDGQGMDTEQFLKMGVNPEKISSINYEQSEVDQANSGILENTGLVMKQGDATDFESLENVGLAANSQEVVTLMHVLEVPNIKGDSEKKLVSNLVKLLKPKGELLVSQYKYKFTKNDRELQRRIGIEEITAGSLQSQFGEDWKKKFREENGLEWEEGMRYGEISNIRTKDQLMKLFEQDFEIKFEETENEFVLKMKKKL